MFAVLNPDNPPVAAIETFQSAMQRIGPVIDRELHRGAVEHETSARDAVRIAADGRAEILPPGEIAIENVMTEHDVVVTSGDVRHQQSLQARAIGDDAGFQSGVVLQDNALDLAAIRQHTEAGTRHAGDRRRIHVLSSNGSTVRRRPSRNASATS
jgi:hypothetical protein